MPNYQNGKIYTLRSHQTDDLYIGSTTRSLAVRKAGHRAEYKRYLNGAKCFMTSFNIIKFEDCYIELIENYPCNSKNELEKREGELIREMNCINRYIAGRTAKEWREANKEKLAEKHKEWREANKEKLAEYREANREKIKEKTKEWREANKEKLAGQMKEYREANRGKIKEKMKNWREANKEKLAEYREANRGKIKEWREENKETLAEKHKEWREANKEILKQKYTCECGGKYTYLHKSTHERSKKHQAYINTEV